jgi:hypothetical protein
VRSGSPHLNYEAWRAPKVGPYVLPPPGEGAARVKTKTTGKTDAKKKPGKSGAKVAKQGLEQAKLTISVEFTREAWDEGEVESVLDAIDPGGPARGGPFPFSYPGLGPGAPQSVLIKSITRPPEWNGTIGSVTIDADGVTLDPVGAGTGAGSGAPRALSASERQALIFANELLRQRILTDQQFLATGTGIPSEIVARQTDMARQIAENNRRLEESARVPEKPTETVQATKNEAEGKVTDAPGAGPKSKAPDAYDPKKNPEAPSAAP